MLRPLYYFSLGVAGSGTRATVSTSRGTSCGVQAAGVSGSGKAQARPRAGSGGAGQTEELRTRIRQAGDDSEAESRGPTRKRRPREVRRWGDTSMAQVDPTRRAADAPAGATSVLDPVGEEPSPGRPPRPSTRGGGGKT